MKRLQLPLFCLVCLQFFGLTSTYSQRAIGIRPLLFQNDFYGRFNDIDYAVQGAHAGEWQFGVSGRKFLTKHFVGRVEANLTTGRYAFTQKRFSYLGLYLIPEFHLTKRFFINLGGFVDTKIKDPYETVKQVEIGVLTSVGFRHPPFEIQGRMQRWLDPGPKFTLGVGIDYFFQLHPKKKVESQ